MFKTVEHFLNEWKKESGNTFKIISVLTDDSLNQFVTDGHRTVGRVIWHIIQCIPEMAGQTGLNIDGPGEKDPVPASADEIRAAYKKAANSLLTEVANNWSDETLEVEDNLYGEMWKRGMTLDILLKHEIHHRGQLTILMREAGLMVPGIYGPQKRSGVTSEHRYLKFKHNQC